MTGMRVAALTLAAAIIGRAGIAHACIQFAETNRLIGWSADGKLALLVAQSPGGRIDHAEIHSTRYEGWNYLITAARGEIAVRKAVTDRCPDWYPIEKVERATGDLTEAKLLSLDVVKRMNLVRLPTVDGSAAKLQVRYVPRKRYGEHRLEVRDGKSLVTTLSVPVWCFGSCHRDEAWETWKAQVIAIVTAGDRRLYAVRLQGVCNGSSDLAVLRVIADGGPEPPRTHCRGSAETSHGFDEWGSGWGKDP